MADYKAEQYAIDELRESEGWKIAQRELISLCAELASVGNAKDWPDVLGRQRAIDLIGEWFSNLGLLSPEEIESGIKSEHLRYFDDK